MRIASLALALTPVLALGMDATKQSTIDEILLHPGAASEDPLESPDDARCRDLSADLCRAQDYDAAKQKAEKLSETLRTKLDQAFNSVHKGRAQDLVRKKLEAEGIHIRSDLPPEEARRLLTPTILLSEEDRAKPSSGEKFPFEGIGPACVFPLPPEREEADIRDLERVLSGFWGKTLPVSYSFLSNGRESSATASVEFKELKAKLLNHPTAKSVYASADDWDLGPAQKGAFNNRFLKYLELEASEISQHNAPLVQSLITDPAIQKYTFFCELVLELRARYGKPDNASITITRSLENHPIACSAYDFFAIDNGIVTAPSNPLWKSPQEGYVALRAQALDLLRQVGPAHVLNAVKAQSFRLSPLTSGDVFAWKVADVQAQLTAPEQLVSTLETKVRSPADVLSFERQYFAASLASPRALYLSNLCRFRNQAVLDRMRDIKVKLSNNLSLSRPVVESVTNFLYSPDQRRNLKTEFDASKREVESIIHEQLYPGVRSAATKARLDKAFSQLDIYLPLDPSRLPWKKDPEGGFEYIDFSKLPVGEHHYNNFLDPTLESFRKINAFYQPDNHQKGARLPNKVVILPGLMMAFADQMMTIRRTVMHELGHHFGPEVSKDANSDVSAAWKKLLDCYAGANSIRMQPEQSDEVVADWISTEAIARAISLRPETERKFAAEQAFAGLCNYYLTDSVAIPGDTHPAMRRRINGILGAHPAIRTALGCPAKGPYSYCSPGNAPVKKGMAR